MAAIVGLIPIMPTIAVTRMSDDESSAISINPSMPATTLMSVSARHSLSLAAFSSLHIPTTSGENSLACFSRSSILLPAASATIFRSS